MIKEATGSVPDAHGGAAASALIGTYNRMRAEALLLIEDEDRPEFERLFGADLPPAATALHARALLGNQERAHEAMSLLGQLAGWLDGFVQAGRWEQEVRLLEHRRTQGEPFHRER